MADAASLQSNIKQNTKDMTKYSLYMGGLNAKNKALAQYSPLKTGYGRIFLVRMPTFMNKMFPTKTKNFKHMIEYGFTALDGLQNLTLEFEQTTGGYAGRQMDVATVAKDETNEITLRAYEFAGSPLREFIQLWISGISDPLSGLTHYHGALEKHGLAASPENHTMEAIYVATDSTGRSDGIEYAALLTNMMPKNAKVDHFNYEAGTHNLVSTDIPFSVVPYQSAQINSIAKALMTKYTVLRNHLDFQSGFTTKDVESMSVPQIADWS